MLKIVYVKDELPWLKMSDVRESIIESRSKGTSLTLKGVFREGVINALLKPAEEFRSVTVITNSRLPFTIESRALSILGLPKDQDPNFYGLRSVDAIVSEGFEKL